MLQSVNAQTSYTWNGSSSSSWNNASNWTPNGIPGSVDNVTIVTGSNTCVLGTASSINNFTLTSGTLDMSGATLTVTGSTAKFTAGTIQNGAIAVTGATTTTFGNGPVTMNCTVNITSATVTLKNTTFQSVTNITKTGTTNDASSGNNIFNGALTATNQGTGWLMFGNGSPDQFNGAATFNNTGSNNIYVAYNSTNNIFGGVTTFNNSPSTNNGIYVAWYSAGTIFNNNIIVNSTSGSGIQFCGGNTAATATLANGQTISVGAGGFSVGTLLLRQFTQMGATAQNLSLTGTASLNFGPSSVFNGSLTTVSPALILSGGTFNGTTNLTKTGATGDWSAGGNTFNGVCSITNSGSSYVVLGNSNPDIWNNDVTFTDNGSERLLPCWATAGNQFNGNIYVNTSGSATGIQFCGGNTTATATLASGKTIQPGAGGLTAGYLYLKQFTQLGNTPINITGTGSSVLYLGPNSNFGGAFAATAPDIWAQGATYNGTAAFTKTGGTYNHNNQNQNIFNSTCTINQQSSTGYFMLGYNSNDLFNGNIILTSTGTSGIYLGWTSGTGTPTLSAGNSISVGAAGFSGGFLSLNTFTELGNAPINLTFTGTNTGLTFARGSVIGGSVTTSTPDVFFSGCTFNDVVNVTKTGAGNDAGAGGNVFQASTAITNAGGGYLILGNGTADTWNAASSFTSSGSSYVGLGWNSAGNTFNGNISVSSSGSSTGILFCSNVASTATLSAGNTVQIGAGGFSTGTLLLRQFTQAGNAPINLTLTGATTLLQSGPSTAIGGSFTVVSPRILLNGAVYSDVVSVTKTGSTGEWSYGGNTFNATLTVNQQGSAYFGFANGAPDIYNGDVYANNNSTDRIIFGNNPTGNQFNGNIILTQIGSSVGIAFGWSSSTNETMAAGKTISIGAAGYSVGYLQIERFTQLGSVPVNLPLTGTSSLTFGPTSIFGGNVTSTSGSLYLNGCTFNGTSNLTKTGTTGDFSQGGNTFNGVCSITNSGSSYLVLGNSNPDTWNSDVTFTDNGSERLLPCWATAGNQFNGNINVNTAGSATGIQFCGGNTTATATLASGGTVQSGATGLTAGYLILKQFTQLGNAPVNLTLNNTATYLQFGPSSAIGGPVLSSSPGLLFNGCTFSDVVTSTKTGASNDASSGNNIFNGVATMTNTGSGYLMFGNGNADQFNTTATFNNTGSNNTYVAYNSAGNTFGGITTFNNGPSTNNGIYVSSYSVGTTFNNNIVVNSTSGSGVQFCTGNTTATATLASGQTLSVGSSGFSSGTLLLRQFTQTGSTAQNLTLTGTGNLTFGPYSAFGGNVTTSSPALLFNGCTFSGPVNSTKTGTTNDQSQGNNIFNGASTFTNNGTGYLLMTVTAPDAYNGNVAFVQAGTGIIYPNYNGNSTYAANVTVTSPAATTMTFGSGTGTASFTANGPQSINVTGATPIPVFTRLAIINTGSGVTLNTSIKVSGNLALNFGLLNTTTSHILTMLNGSTTAAGNALSTSYVNGPMQYQKSTVGATTLNFPIGNGADCRPVILTVNHTTGTQYTYQAQLFDASAAALGYTLPPTVTSVSNVHYYTIGRTNAAGVSQPTLDLNGNQTIQVFFGANDGVTDGGNLVIVKNTYLAPTAWINIGGTGGPAYSGGANLTGSVTSTSSPTAFNSFSTFALANPLGGINILPVGLLSFTATPVNDKVMLNWVTSAEIDDSYFAIERSRDGVTFDSLQTIETEAPGGNSAVSLAYTAYDQSPYTGFNYYRLKQVHTDGYVTYSAIDLVKFGAGQNVSVYPNPTTGPVYISGIAKDQESLTAEWFDAGGRSMGQQTVSAQNGTARLDTHFTNGVYFLRLLFADGTIKVQKVIVER